MWRVVCAALVAGMFALAPGVALAQDGLVVERFDAELEIDPSGTVEVTEELLVDFGEEEFHGIERAIPVSFPLDEDDAQIRLPEDREPADFHRVIEIDSVTVTSTAPDDVEVERDGDVLLVRIGDPDDTVTGTHTYELRYRVHGALNAFEDRAELTWDVTGHGWGDPILAASAVVTAPEVLAGACARGPEGDPTPCEQAEVGDTGATFATGRLDPQEGLTVSVGLPLDAVAVPPPLLEEQWRFGAALAGGDAAWPLTALTAVLGTAAVAAVARYRRQRVRAVAHASSGVALRGDPPDGLAPAQLRMLVKERADDVALGATLLDLAARGHVDIEPRSDEGDEDDVRYVFRRVDGSGDDLAAYERALLEGMFAEGDTVTGEAFAEDHVDDQVRFREQVEAAAVGPWFPASPAHVRARRALLGAIVVGLALALLGAALAVTRVAVAAVPLVIASLAVAVLVYRLPTRTAEGRRLLAEARGFEAFLAGTGQSVPGDDRAPSEVFGLLLPYAMALGVASHWVARFEATGAPSQQWMPAYYAPIFAAAGSDPGGFASSVSSFGAQVTPAPSTSTSGGGATAGSGVGGGGGGAW